MIQDEPVVSLPRPALRGRGIYFYRPIFWLFVTLGLTTLVYIPGLNGPFLFDDVPNLRPLQDWLIGVIGWQEVLLGNRSGLFGRPLSMLSFSTNAMFFGMGPFSFKLTNLLIHLTCGVLIYKLLSSLLTRDTQLAPQAQLVALTVSAVWLLHPLQVSTVLYIVQRMAQLSTMFTLFALLAFVHGRMKLDRGQQRAGLTWLFLGVPSATVLGILCKENGALAPLLCAVLELGYFRVGTRLRRPTAVRVFFCLGLILPIVAVGVWYTWPPSRLLASYSVRTFTLSERLLTEPRVLFDYISTLLLPQGPAMGLYTDDFVVSRSFLQPVTTVLSAIGLFALALIALIARQRSQAVFTGIAFYMAGHVMESSVFPLELYFEHRNYLPSVGLFLALSGVVAWLFKQKRAPFHPTVLRVLTLSVIALCLTLASATAARAWVWQSWSTMVRQGVLQHPHSTRAQFDNLSLAWNLGSPEATRSLLDELARNGSPSTRQLAVISTLLQECEAQGAIEPSSLTRVLSLTGNKLQLADMTAFEQIGGYLRTHNCDGLDKIKLADVMRKVADAAPQPQSNTAVWRIRFMAADLYARAGQTTEAQRQAALAWATRNTDPAVGILLIRLQIFNQDIREARMTRTQLESRVAPWDRRTRALLSTIDKELAHPNYTGLTTGS